MRKLIRAVSNLWKCSGHAHKRAKNRAVSGVSASLSLSSSSLTYEHEISGGPHVCSENRPRPGKRKIGSKIEVPDRSSRYWGSAVAGRFLGELRVQALRLLSVAADVRFRTTVSL